EPIVGVGEEARLAHLAVGDDVEADLGLATHHVAYGFGGARSKLGVVDGLTRQTCAKQRSHAFRTRDAPDVRRENTLGAGLQGSASDKRATQTSRGRSPSTMIRHSTRLCRRS